MVSSRGKSISSSEMVACGELTASPAWLRPTSRELNHMADVVDAATRSRMMASIGPTHTRPEVLVRSYLHRTGLRFRLHAKGLAGRPDLVLPNFHAVVFVHGCFWHRHQGCRFATTPATRYDFWQTKFRQNVSRDQRVVEALRECGWRVFTVWECEVEDQEVLDRLYFSIVAGVEG